LLLIVIICNDLTIPKNKTVRLYLQKHIILQDTIDT
jgi:hypothetical protein